MMTVLSITSGGGSIDWGESFFEALDSDLLAARWRKWSSQELYAVAQFSGHLVSENTNENRQLIRHIVECGRVWVFTHKS